mgnify:CR=1 FL=1
MTVITLWCGVAASALMMTGAAGATAIAAVGALLALLLAASLSLAQGTFLDSDESNRMPTPGEIELARQKTQEALNRLPDAPVIRQQFGGVTPRVEAMPRPATPASQSSPNAWRLMSRTTTR